MVIAVLVAMSFAIFLANQLVIELKVTAIHAMTDIF
jgi:hypothetical protein